MRKHPVKAKIILNYLRFAWNKSTKKNTNAVTSAQEVKAQQATATGQPQSFVQVSDGQGGSSSSTSGNSSGSSQGSGMYSNPFIRTQGIKILCYSLQNNLKSKLNLMKYLFNENLSDSAH